MKIFSKIKMFKQTIKYKLLTKTNKKKKKKR